MKVSSFDIFDTCLVRKCGTPENFFDVFSLRAFNGEVEEWVRQEFVAARVLSQKKIETESTKIEDIWGNFSWSHPKLKPILELCQLEQEIEREMLVPVLKMRDKVNECRKQGDKVIFISDMYLSSKFLIIVLREHGFYQEGDSLYVSCECNARKSNGKLYEYIKDKELITYSHWYHYGDNKQSDFKEPRKLGIKAAIVQNEYTPYQKMWVKNNYSLEFKYASILAGLGKAAIQSREGTPLTPYTLDVVAPFYMSMLVRMMNDAKQNKIKRMYFCARDAYILYLMAQKLNSVYPTIKVEFVYMSKKSLYEGNEDLKWRYFEQIGLASQTDKIGLVDIRSTGRTLNYLNEHLRQRGYQEVRGYLFEIYASGTMQYQNNNCYREVTSPYVSSFSHDQRLLNYGLIYEQFFSLNTLNRTIGYFDNDGVVEPIFDVKDKETEEVDKFKVDDMAFLSEQHQRLLEEYAEEFIRLKLHYYANQIYENVAIPTLANFFNYPRKEYLYLFTKSWGHKYGDPTWYPYVRYESIFRLLMEKGKDTLWKRATIIYSLPYLIILILKKLHER